MLDVVAAVIFTLIDVKGEFESKQQQPCHFFALIIFLDSGWSFCGGIILFLMTILECYHMECSLSPMRPVCYIIPTTENNFQTSLYFCFEVIHENPCKLQSIFSPMSPTFCPILPSDLLN